MDKQLNEKIAEIKQLPFVNDAWLDDDCRYEGYVSIQIELKEEDNG